MDLIKNAKKKQSEWVRFC